MEIGGLKDILLKLTGHSLFGLEVDRSVCPMVSPEDWAALRRLAVCHKVAGFVWDAVNDLGWVCESFASMDDSAIVNGLNPAEKTKWAMCVHSIEVSYSQLTKAASAITGTLKANGFRFRLLKGIALAQVYPVPSHRTFGDLDIYIPERFSEAESLLLSSFGGVSEAGLNHHDKLTIKNVEIELHRSFFNLSKYASNRRLQKELDTLYKGTYSADLAAGSWPVSDVSSGSTVLSRSAALSVPGVSGDDQSREKAKRTADLIFILRHAGSHFVSAELSLMNITDVGRFIMAYDDVIDYQKVEDVAARCGFAEWFHLLPGILARHLGFKFPARLSAFFRSAGFSTHDESLMEKVLDSILAPDYTADQRSSKGVSTLTSWFFGSRWKSRLVFRRDSTPAVFLRTILFWFRRKLS